MQRVYIKILLFAVLLLSPLREVSAALNTAQEFYLDNGMQVVVIPNHKAPLVFHAVMYHAGSANDAPGKGGTAHLLEHLMFRGTKKVKSGEFNRLIEDNGGTGNAGTSYDYTIYYQLLNIDSLELAMYLESDRMQGLKINEDDFYKERDIVFEERQQRLDDGSGQSFWESYNTLFWQDTPYTRPISGTDVDIKNLTSSDVRHFYQKYYVPDNAVLILAGDIELDTAKELAKKYYGSINRQATADEENIKKHKKTAIRLEGRSSDVLAGRTVARYRLPHFDSNDSSLYAWLLFGDYLGAGSNSIFYELFVDKYKQSASFQSGLSYTLKKDAFFWFYCAFNEEKQLSKIEKTYTEALQTAGKKITSKILSELQEKRISSLVYANDNPQEAGMLVASWLTAGYSLSDLQKFEENIKSVTVNQMRDVADTLSRMRPDWGILLPEGAADGK